MKNPDKTQAELVANLQTAMNEGGEEQFISAFTAMAEHMQSGILAEARSMTREEMSDHAALAARGVHQLTAAEKKYYNAVISGNQDGSAFAGAEEIPPPTIINRVFEYLRGNYELLELINMQAVGANTKFWVRDGDVESAFWRKLSGSSKELPAPGFVSIDVGMQVLTAYLPLHHDMLQLGPEWLDRYVREVLAEAMAYGLEKAIVDGDGAETPVGITRDMSTATDNAHPRKDAVEILDFQPVTLGTRIMAPLTRGGRRNVRDVILVVNPLDYWKIVYGATTILPMNGQYLHGILPIPARFIQSAAMPEGYMAAGMARDYFLGVGFKTGIITSDEHRFIDRQRVYLTELAANGRPLDKDSFLLFDISKVLPQLAPTVNVTSGAGNAGMATASLATANLPVPVGGTVGVLEYYAALSGIEIPAEVKTRDDIEAFLVSVVGEPEAAES